MQSLGLQTFIYLMDIIFLWAVPCRKLISAFEMQANSLWEKIPE